jgi:hypothetical protein
VRQKRGILVVCGALNSSMLAAPTHTILCVTRYYYCCWQVKCLIRVVSCAGPWPDSVLSGCRSLRAASAHCLSLTRVLTRCPALLSCTRSRCITCAGCAASSPTRPSPATTWSTSIVSSGWLRGAHVLLGAAPAWVCLQHPRPPRLLALPPCLCPPPPPHHYTHHHRHPPAGLHVKILEPRQDDDEAAMLKHWVEEGERRAHTRGGGGTSFGAERPALCWC